nr:myb-related protein Hv1-like [Ipomoea batatas]
MGIDPITHKPKSNPFGSKEAANLRHMAQWETARLEAEARLVRHNSTMFGSSLSSPSPPHHVSLLHKTPRNPPPPPTVPPPLDVLKAWQAAWTPEPPMTAPNPRVSISPPNVDGQSPTTLNFSDQNLLEGSTSNMNTFGNPNTTSDDIMSAAMDPLSEFPTFILPENLSAHCSNGYLDSIVENCGALSDW